MNAVLKPSVEDVGVALEVNGLDGPAPCDTCELAERCRRERLACPAFARYVEGDEETRWQRLPRLPSHGQFLQIFTAPPRKVGRTRKVSSDQLGDG